MSRGGWVVNMVMLILSGLTLTFSMPWAATVEELITFPWNPSPAVFFSVLTLMMALIGVNRGTVLAPRGPMHWRHLVPLFGHLVFSHVLVVPYLVLVRSLMPGHGLRIPILAGFSILVSLAVGIASYVRQARRWNRGQESSGVVYVAVVMVFALPLIAWAGRGLWHQISILSPIGAISQMLSGSERLWTAIGFAIPAAVCLCLCLTMALGRRRWSR